MRSSEHRHPRVVTALATALTLTISATPWPVRADDDRAVLTDLVDAAAQRLQIAEPVAAFKWHNHSAVEDPARDYVTTVFTDQVTRRRQARG